jgi:hypothetical protein
MTRCLSAVLALTPVLAASSAAAAPPSLRVLFVGNSLTATNVVGVPARTSRLLQATAARALGRRVPAARRCGH